MGPSFLHTSTAFWLDFQGLGPPGESKKQEKLPNYHRFFDMEKRPPKPFFIILRSLLGSFRGAFWSTFGASWSTFEKFCCFSLEVSGGPLRDRFWLHFGLMLHWFYEHLWCNVGGVFLRKMWFYLHANAFFKCFYLFLRLFPVGRHFKNSSFTCMGAQFSRIRIGGTGCKAFTIHSWMKYLFN